MAEISRENPSVPLEESHSVQELGKEITHNGIERAIERRKTTKRPSGIKHLGIMELPGNTSF